MSIIELVEEELAPKQSNKSTKKLAPVVEPQKAAAEEPRTEAVEEPAEAQTAIKDDEICEASAD
jgi:hypothetical protein